MRRVIPGGLSVSEAVIADLVGYAASECYGIVGMVAPTATNEFLNLFPANKLKRGVVVHSKDGLLIIDLYVEVEYGVNISTVSANLVERVAYILEYIAQIVPAEINVHVESIKIRD